MKKTGDYRFGIGVPTLLMLCVVLALTTLGVLSYTAGRANLSLTDRTVAMTEAYYESAAQAQEALSRLDADLVSLRKQATSEAEYSALVAVYAGENGMSFHQMTLSWELDAGSARRLSLSALVSPLADSARYTLTRHALTGGELIEEEPTLNLYH